MSSNVEDIYFNFTIARLLLHAINFGLYLHEIGRACPIWDSKWMKWFYLYRQEEESEATAKNFSVFINNHKLKCLDKTFSIIMKRLWRCLNRHWLLLPCHRQSLIILNEFLINHATNNEWINEWIDYIEAFVWKKWFKVVNRQEVTL